TWVTVVSDAGAPRGRRLGARPAPALARLPWSGARPSIVLVLGVREGLRLLQRTAVRGRAAAPPGRPDPGAGAHRGRGRRALRPGADGPGLRALGRGGSGGRGGAPRAAPPGPGRNPPPCGGAPRFWGPFSYA